MTEKITLSDLKGILPKPSKPVSIEDMNKTIIARGCRTPNLLREMLKRFPEPELLGQFRQFGEL